MSENKKTPKLKPKIKKHNKPMTLKGMVAKLQEEMEEDYKDATDEDEISDGDLNICLPQAMTNITQVENQRQPSANLNGNCTSCSNENQKLESI